MNQDTVVFSACRSHYTRFYRLLYRRINRVIEMKGAAHVWEVIMQRNVIFIDMLQYIPLIAEVLMAIVQFVPNAGKCLKLTLHLPYPELKMTGNMCSPVWYCCLSASLPTSF